MKHQNEMRERFEDMRRHFEHMRERFGRDGQAFGGRRGGPDMQGDERGGFGPRGFGRRGFGPEGFGRRGEDEGGRRGRRRMFEGGELRLVMLLLMESEPRHGYDIIREIETRTSGAYAPSPGVVYPTLTMLEEMGQAEAQASEGSKKRYAITPAGVEHLNANRAEAEAALARIDALGKKDEALDGGPIHRAMSNLKTALRQRLSSQADKQLLFAIADEIDEAARRIERL
jgi:DNA-binding PadR family transcriptional regulator